MDNNKKRYGFLGVVREGILGVIREGIERGNIGKEEIEKDKEG